MTGDWLSGDGFAHAQGCEYEGVREPAIQAGIAEPEAFDAWIRALYRTAAADGVFCYMFFKGVGWRK